MRRKKIYMILCLSITFLQHSTCLKAEDLSAYLIMGDIPPYQRLTEAFDAYTDKLKTIPGYTVENNSGVLAGTDHFLADHTDVSYNTYYQDDVRKLGAEVQVTQHTGGGSDKWLLHEVEDSYRNSEDKDEGLGKFYGKLREIDGQRVIYSGLGGGNYTWLNNNVVVNIEYTDLYRQSPEPLEVIQAYLQKFPSTIPATLVLDKAHDTQWIKDEMERRLWLCDKWFEQLGLGKAERKDALYNVVRSLSIFLDYREKYYGWSAMEEKGLLMLYQNNGSEAKVREKLQEYKVWWTANKGGTVLGFISVYMHKASSYVSRFFKTVFDLLGSLIRGILMIFG